MLVTKAPSTRYDARHAEHQSNQELGHSDAVVTLLLLLEDDQTRLVEIQIGLAVPRSATTCTCTGSYPYAGPGTWGPSPRLYPNAA